MAWIGPKRRMVGRPVESLTQRPASRSGCGIHPVHRLAAAREGAGRAVRPREFSRIHRSPVVMMPLCRARATSCMRFWLFGRSSRPNFEKRTRRWHLIVSTVKKRWSAIS